MQRRDDALETMHAVLNTHRVLAEAMEKRLRAQAGLSLAQFEVLSRLHRAPGTRLRMVDITRQLCVSKSGVTQLVDRLERAGLVTKERRGREQLVHIDLAAVDRATLLEQLHEEFTSAGGHFNPAMSPTPMPM